MQQKLSPVLNEKEIIKASDAIDKALENINNSNRGEVAVRILSVVRNLNELGNSDWELAMKSKRRKTLVVCSDCHRRIHK